jgi:hypothetical protein
LEQSGGKSGAVTHDKVAVLIAKFCDVKEMRVKSLKTFREKDKQLYMFMQQALTSVFKDVNEWRAF